MSEPILTMNKNLVDASGRPIIIPTIISIQVCDFRYNREEATKPTQTIQKAIAALDVF